ncbi:Asp-tRNA(Asn)/Glu-tRNA(Gln) amidotransferase A subunit family amidase [Bradyrhizobium sp. USDA 4448]
MALSQLCDTSAVELRRLLAARTISPVELLDSCLSRIATTNAAVNAVVTLDEPGARRRKGS